MAICKIELGCSAPVEEDCVEVSSDVDYLPLMRIEAQVFRDMLKRLFPVPEGSYGSLRISSNYHDFGSYLDIVIAFDDTDEQSVEWAFNIEANVPEKWDEQARQELQKAGYFAKNPDSSDLTISL